MSKLWRYRRDGQECGPVTSADLKLLADSGRLLPTDQVQKEGASKWLSARSVRGLFGDAAKPGFFAKVVAVWGKAGLVASGFALVFVVVGLSVLAFALHSSASTPTPPSPSVPAPVPSTAPVVPPTHLLGALREMRAARAELRGGGRESGERLEKASHAVERAIDQTERGLRAAGVDVTTQAADPETYKKHGDHPHLRDALTEILEARIEVKEANIDFGGERDQMIRELGSAADQIEQALKDVR